MIIKKGKLEVNYILKRFLFAMLDELRRSGSAISTLNLGVNIFTNAEMEFFSLKKKAPKQLKDPL